VTKHIKIYSDNPIHDCIDRIINSCVGLDLDSEDSHYYAINLKDSAEELLDLAMRRASEETQLYVARMNGRYPG
jgi:hypothetical protein